MKKLRWFGYTMLAVLVLLAGCNQAEEQIEEETEQETEDQSSEDSQENDQLISMAETFINQLSEGQYEEATENFDETMKEQLTPDALEELWVNLTNQVGDFIGQEYNTIKEADGYQVVLMTGIFNDADVTFQVSFDENQQIAGFYVQ